VDGERIVVCLSWEDFVRLLTNAAPTAETAPDTNDQEAEGE
jgi:hypothetical protein